MFSHSGDSKKYDLAACVQEYIWYKLECLSGIRSVNFDIERAEHERAKKEITVLKLRKYRRELHESSVVEAAIGDMLIRFRSKLLSVPAKMAMQLLNITDANEVSRILKQEMSECLDELSDYNPDDFSEDVIDYDDDEDDEENTETDSEDM